jgi:hypothetical protein
MSAPRLAAARLIWRNRRARAKSRPVLMLLGFGLAAALIWVVTAVALPITWLRSHDLLCAGLTAVVSAVLIARRRALKRSEFARSWLAAVPVTARIARWEALLIETVPAIAAIALLTICSASYALMLFIANSTEISAPFAVWAYFSGGIAAGVGGSFLIPQPKPLDLPPGSRYVPKPKLQRAAKIRPSLSALGAWPIRLAFARAQPKIVARATLPILVMMPLGTTADSAMVAIALFGVICVLLLVSSAVISVGSLARRWLAPVPVASGDVIRAVLLRACAVIVAAGAIEALLLMVFGVSYRSSAEVGACTAMLGCLMAGGGLIWSWSSSSRA